jgi:hypothetical protein
LTATFSFWLLNYKVMGKKERKYDKTFLDIKLAETGATQIGEYDKLNSYSTINFICSCGNACSKKFQMLVYGSGALCKECTKQHGKDKLKQTMIEHYGVDNALKSEIIKEKLKKTVLEKYGTTSVLKSKSVKEKIIKTNIEKYGVSNPLSNEAIKEKIKHTNLEKYGVVNPLQSKEINAKLEATSMKKYGCRRPSENKTIRTKIKKAHLEKTDEEKAIIREKVKETCLEKYGVESTNQLESIKEKKRLSCLEKYGVENPNQLKEFMEKTQKSAKRHKEYKMPSGDIRIVQGYEPYALNILVKKYKEDDIMTGRKDIPRIPYIANSKNRYHFPDIYIPSTNTLIEVKSTWTYKCTTDNVHIKEAAAKTLGYNYEIWVFNGKGERVEIS